MAVSDSGWSVVGLSPAAPATPTVVDPPGPPVVTLPVVTPPAAATPGPTTLALAGLGLPLAPTRPSAAGAQGVRKLKLPIRNKLCALSGCYSGISQPLSLARALIFKRS